MLQQKKLSYRLGAVWQLAMTIILMCCGAPLIAQVETRVDTTTITIGEELLLTMEVEVDTTSRVMFPEGQTFQPLELLESYTIDTTKNGLKTKLIKTYGLTQFDSGAYTIPKQKILINDNVVLSDSVRIQIRAVKVDTTKQKLYDIKPIIDVEKPSTNLGWPWWVVGFVLITLLLLYKFVWHKNAMVNNQKKSFLPPYEHAKRALLALDEKQYFEDNNTKSFYSELTFILRQYLNEKVYNKSLESTTVELLDALREIKKTKTIVLHDDTLKNMESILKRADLVKFAKSTPPLEVIRADKNLIEAEIDLVKKGLPEPSEEELKRDLEYQKKMLKKKKQQQIKLAGITSAGLIILGIVGCSLYFGFTTVKDTLLRHPSKLLLETERWVSSEYGAPGITIETPEVLGRKPIDSLSQQISRQMKTKLFEFIDEDVPIRILVKSSRFEGNKGIDRTQKEPIDLLSVADNEISGLGQLGAFNILPKNEQFITPNGQEGLKTYGNAMFPFDGDNPVDTEFVILGFSTADFLQQLVLVWASEDDYTKQICNRILNSVELIKLNQE